MPVTAARYRPRRAHAPTGIIGLAATTALIVTGLAAPSPASAAPTDTQVISYTGAPVSYTVPTATTAINVTVNGAAGGGGDGGFGAKVTTTLTVAPGQILQITAGGTGGVGSGGFNGGANPGAPGSGGVGVNFGGGGASDIRAGACAQTLSCGLTSRVITAGGGGGGDIVTGAWATPTGGAGGTPIGGAGGDSRASGVAAAPKPRPVPAARPGLAAAPVLPGKPGHSAPVGPADPELVKNFVWGVHSGWVRCGRGGPWPVR